MSNISPTDNLIWQIGKGDDTAFIYHQKGFSLPKPLPLRFRKHPQSRKIELEPTGTRVFTPEFVPQVHLVSAYPPTALATQHESGQWRSEVVHDHGLININAGEWRFEKDASQLPANATPRGYDWSASRVIRVLPQGVQPEGDCTTSPGVIQQSLHRNPIALPSLRTARSRHNTTTSPVTEMSSPSTFTDIAISDPKLVRKAHEEQCGSFLAEVLAEPTSSLDVHRSSTPSVMPLLSLSNRGSSCGHAPGFHFAPETNTEPTAHSKSRVSSLPSSPLSSVTQLHAPAPHIFSHTQMAPSALREAKEVARLSTVSTNLFEIPSHDADTRRFTATATDGTVISASSSTAVRAAAVAFGHIPQRPRLAQTYLKRIIATAQRRTSQASPSQISPANHHLANDSREQDTTSQSATSASCSSIPAHIRVASEIQIKGGYPINATTVLRRIELPKQTLEVASSRTRRRAGSSASTAPPSTQAVDCLPGENLEYTCSQDVQASDTESTCNEANNGDIQPSPQPVVTSQEPCNVMDRIEDLDQKSEVVLEESVIREELETIDLPDSSHQCVNAISESNAEQGVGTSGIIPDDNNATNETDTYGGIAAKIKESDASQPVLQDTAQVCEMDDQDVIHELEQNESVVMSSVASEGSASQEYDAPTTVKFAPPPASTEQLTSEVDAPRYFQTSRRSPAYPISPQLQEPPSLVTIPVTVPNTTTISPALLQEMVNNGETLPEPVIIAKNMSYSRSLQTQLQSKSHALRLGPSFDSSGPSPQPPQTVVKGKNSLPYTSIKDWKRQRSSRLTSQTSRSHTPKETSNTEFEGCPSGVTGHALSLTPTAYPHAHPVYAPIPPSTAVENDAPGSTLTSSLALTQHEDLVGSLADLSPDQLESVVRAAVARRELRINGGLNQSDQDGPSYTF